jgi:hypothetical protein
VILAVLIAQFAVAGSGTDEGKIASLQRQIDRLKAQVAQGPATAAKKKKVKRGPPGPAGPQGAAGSQGPSGAQGPAGTAPACQGNGSGDTMVAAGSVCIDRYEVSVWSSPTGGTQYGTTSDNYPAACSDTGQGCKAGTAGAIYARSVPGVVPSIRITYFQAAQALANVGKRLPTNAEWQQAAAGTPEGSTGNCQVSAVSQTFTGSLAGCISNWGANDMVGNVWEWVADWVVGTTGCTSWVSNGTFSSTDTMCLSGASTTAQGPGALARGGDFAGGTGAGPFAVNDFFPQANGSNLGFRGAR